MQNAAPTPAENAASPASDGAMLRGTVERILFANGETGYTVASVRPEGAPANAEPVTVVGTLAGIQPQEFLEMGGVFINDKRFGRQFKVETYSAQRPSGRAAIEKYLGSGLISGIGATYAKRMVEAFGEEIFNIIEFEPERLAQVGGIGKKRREKILESWAQHRAVREILVFLNQYEIPATHAQAIYKRYGDEAIELLRTNPYQLARDIRGIGFKSADRIAQKLGIPQESLERAQAGIVYLLQELTGDGHTFYPADPLIVKAQEMLGVPQELVVEAIRQLAGRGDCVLDLLPDGTRAVYQRQQYTREVAVAQYLITLLNTGKLFPKIDPEAQIAAFEETAKFKLAAAQRQAVADALHGGVQIVTGGPGTGKTTIVRTILRILERCGCTVLLAAPTGRAAKRMNEVTHHPASTIHRLLQISPEAGRFLRGANNPLKADFLILDETSMIDIGLADMLLRAVAPTTSVIFVGDADQLPSVGPGNFLRDIIGSGTIPVCRLNDVFRQARQSMIVQNAHRINQGTPPALRPESEEDAARQDFFFVEAEDPEACLQATIEVVLRRIPKKFGYNCPADIQVLTPMHRGTLGSKNLNKALQAAVNGKAQTLERGEKSFRMGDKVMQMSNDYDKNVFNGDMGRVLSIDREEQFIRVDFDGNVVTYEFSELDDLELSYATTIHKSQGSEYTAVVMPVHAAHYVMLHRNLIYTGLTRGKKLVVIVGQRKAIDMAVRNVNAEPRYSALHQRLRAMRAEHVSPVEL